jgi:tetratricopeptide (TPR) repeat protein
VAAHAWLAHLHLVRGDPAAAWAAAEQGGLASGPMRAYQALGLLWDPAKGAAVAIQAATASLAADPSDPLTWIVRGFARLKSGDPRGAAEDLRVALECNPEPPYEALARLLLDLCGGADEAAVRAGARRCRAMPLLAPWRDELDVIGTYVETLRRTGGGARPQAPPALDDPRPPAIPREPRRGPTPASPPRNRSAEVARIIAAADDAFADGLSPDNPYLVDIDQARRVLDLVDGALASWPRDTELLMARAAALSRLLRRRDAEAAIDEVLAIDPAHFDAARKRRSWDSWHLLFDLPAWSERATSAAPLYRTSLGAVEPGAARLYLARTGLELGIVAVQSTQGLLFERGIDPSMRAQLQVKLVETPFGPVASYYMLLDDDPAKPCVPIREGTLATHHARGGGETTESGLALLHRLAVSAPLHLVFVAGEDVRYNRRAALLAKQREALRAKVPALLENPVAMDAAQRAAAMRWYEGTTELSDIRWVEDQPRSCPACGAAARSGARFCVRCGGRLDAG